MTLLRDFESLGIDGRSVPTWMVGKFSGRCVVVASAACVWEDLSSIGLNRISAEGDYGWAVMCVNDTLMHWPGIVHHAYSNQHRWFDGWLKARRETIAGYVTRRVWGEVRHVHSNNSGGDYQWPWPGTGTSTLNAVYTALALGYAPVVICGAPLDSSPHYFDPPWAATNFNREVGQDKANPAVPQYWGRAKKHIFRDRVFSQSGRTRELLGAYTP